MRVTNSNYFLLPGNKHILHLATISEGLREYILMLCIKGNKAGNVYIEEVVLNSIDFGKDLYANCKFIEDDNLANELAKFCEDKKLVDMKRVTETLLDMKRKEWLPSSIGLKK